MMYRFEKLNNEFTLLFHLQAVTPSEYLKPNINGTGICSPGINPRINPFQGLFVEFLISLILVLVCCGVWDSRNKDKHDSVTIRFGLTVAVLAMAGVSYQIQGF